MRLWLPSASGRGAMVEAAARAGLTSTAVGHALVPFDYDSDGDLDILVANYGAAPTLYRNDTPDDRHWLTVRLDDPETPGNRQGIGAHVRVSLGSDDAVTGWIGTAGSYESQRPAELHVGLGDRSAPVDRVEVWWPGETEPQTIEGLRPDQVLTVTRSGR